MRETIEAFKFLFMGPVIVMMLAVINLMTSPDELWFQWAGLGIGIAWLFSLLRVIKTTILTGGLIALFAFLRNR